MFLLVHETCRSGESDPSGTVEELDLDWGNLTALEVPKRHASMEPFVDWGSSGRFSCHPIVCCSVR